jgi:predicted ATPase
VLPHGTATWPDGTVTGQYRFRHALYQEVVYTRIPVGSRARLHQQIGGRLETAYAAQAREIAAELAVHFMHGRDTHRAIRYLQQATENARQRHAHQEVMAHCTMGLELLATLPETPERAGHELAFYTVLGPELIPMKGFLAPDMGQFYVRAHALCQALKEPTTLFAMRFGLVIWHMARGECAAAQELAEQLLQLAHEQDDSAWLLAAHMGLAMSFAQRGELATAWVHQEAGLALYASQQHPSYRGLYGQDPEVMCLAYAADILWLRGYPDQALAHLDTALQLAREPSRPFSLAFVLSSAVHQHVYRRDGHAVHQWAAALITLATEQEFPYWLVRGRLCQGWALVEQGQAEEGMAQMRHSVEHLRTIGAWFRLPHCLGLLAEAHGRQGEFSAGLTLLDEALAMIQQGEQHLYTAEIYRIRGDLLVQTGGRHQEAEAEASLRQALEVARQQQARSFELRAAVSLGRLWQRQGKPDAARQLLGQVYSWFSEGFDTADLQDAKTLLETLEWEPLAALRAVPPSSSASNGVPLCTVGLAATPRTPATGR